MLFNVNENFFVDLNTALIKSLDSQFVSNRGQSKVTIPKISTF